MIAGGRSGGACCMRARCIRSCFCLGSGEKKGEDSMSFSGLLWVELEVGIGFWVARGETRVFLSVCSSCRACFSL